MLSFLTLTFIGLGWAIVGMGTLLLALVATVLWLPGHFPFDHVDSIFDLSNVLAVTLMLRVLLGAKVDGLASNKPPFDLPNSLGGASLLAVWALLFLLAGRS